MRTIFFPAQTCLLGWLAGFAAAGAFSLAGAETAPEAPLPTVGRVVELPPFMVQETEKHSPWLYGRLPGFEILSRCPESETDHLVEKVYRAHQLFTFLVPQELHPVMSAPTTYLIYGDDMKQAVPPEVLHAMTRVNFTPNFMLTDTDELEVVALVPRYSRHTENLVLTPASVHYMLSKRVPPPPIWFLDGFTTLYEETAETEEAIKISSANWITDQITESIRRDPDFPRQLLPMAELFSPFRSGPSRHDGQFLDVWRSQAALFIRWALDRSQSAGPAALWKFVDGASAGPVKESFFQECFGLNYADMLDRLTDYLPKAVNYPLRLAPSGDLPEMPEFELRRATDTEVSRITGDWERLEVAYVKSRYPPLTGRYLDQALLTVRAAYNRGERDPGLLAVLGLDAVEAGEPAQARDFLEGAVKGRVPRPRVYYELARLRYSDARLIPAGPGGAMSAGQVAGVLEMLERGRQLKPALAELYELACSVWLHTAEKATPAQLAVLEEGVRMFPWNFSLIMQVSAIESRQNRTAEGAALLAHGLERAPEGATRERLLQLQRLLIPAAGPPP